ncbi:MAG: hypothetical protein QXT77_05390, partial [Candidatus Methanomethylicaceae archaeon]
MMNGRGTALVLTWQPVNRSDQNVTKWLALRRVSVLVVERLGESSISGRESCRAVSGNKGSLGG